MSKPDRPAAERRPRSPAGPDLDQPFDVHGLYALRATVAAHAGRLGVAEEAAERLLIVASELAANAIRHGGGRGRLLLWLADGRVYCQVTDEGPGIADGAVGVEPPDPAGTGGGRGMWICRRLSEELIIEPGPGAVVTAVLEAG
jgi:anti-sigma regulatory factor (Ser/Thr protein kinase)